MSQLRQPAARADRREGGRHGRPAGRAAPQPTETHIRSQLLRIAILPPLAVALGASAAVLFVLQHTGVRPSATLWAVLGGACLVTVAGIVIAAIAARRTAAVVRDRVLALRQGTAHRQSELRALVEQLRKGEAPPPRRAPAVGAPGGDDFDRLGVDLARGHDIAVTAVVQATQLSSQAGSRQKVEVFVNLARRLQSLVHREISLLDELENQVEDPDLLKGLFHVDHMATRTRRHAENLAVLGGAVSRRQWSHPVSMTEVMRSAIAEVEQYSRVKLVPPIDGTLRGHAVADCIHLLAELVENATVFSAPHTQVLLRANQVTSGLAIEVEDRGLGMPVTEQNKMNTLLTDPDQVNVASLLADGRIGLFVVSQLARRHGITVRLQTNIYGGVQAVLVLPQDLLGGDGDTDGAGVRIPHVRKAAAAATANSVLGGEPTPSANGHRAGPPPQSAPDTNGTRPAPANAPAPAPPSPAPLHGAVSVVPRQPPTGTSPAGAPTGTPLAGMPTGTPPAGTPTGTPPTGTPTGTPPAGTPIGAPPSAPPTDTPTTGTPPAGTPTGLPARGAPLNGASTGIGTGTGTPTGTPPNGTSPATPPAPSRPGTHAAPLPQRIAGDSRPTPADAVPGIRPETREAAAHAEPPVARPEGAVRGTMGRPQLPRRRAQEHIAPQLRGGPAPRHEDATPSVHDPGLMAAFQRGITLAESAEPRAPGDEGPDAQRWEPGPDDRGGAPA
ncbi:ATP-binding protein [Streptomyces sp. NBC_01016]|uniref:ATP-binding protein n=1 Tax=Streptomyces sp. NBC_01016 TaxID=2903720 RepID=UPI0022584B1F|nr:ATP-binding protein [Streptomyces sp. NBC_01016]MCX4834134.1 ATP-binding protein [Streptomyces sp. NBC_01016]